MSSLNTSLADTPAVNRQTPLFELPVNSRMTPEDVAVHDTIRKVIGYARNGHEIITMALVYMAITGLHLGEPDLQVTYDSQNLGSAARLSREIDQLPLETKHAAWPLRSAAERVATSPDLLRIDITNNTHERVTDLEVGIPGVVEVADAAIVTSSQVMNRDAERLATVVLNNSIATLPNLKELPPHAHVTIFLWGKVSALDFFDGIRVVAAVPRVQVSERQTATGLRLFVARNLGSLTVILLVYFLLTAIARTRRNSEQNASTA